MGQIIWTEDFSVGIPKIDEQHKRLVKMINKLIEAPPVTTKSETISELLNDMTNYAREHFTTEEELMQQYNYPDIQEHTAQHRAFRKQTVEFCSATMLDVQCVPAAILDYLSNWLVEHILNSDMKYKSFFHEHGVK